MLLASDPFLGGYTQEGMVYHLDSAAPGMGVTLAEIDSDEDEDEEEEGEETGVGASDSTE